MRDFLKIIFIQKLTETFNKLSLLIDVFDKIKIKIK